MLLDVPHLLVFDLDGTLIDSRVDLCNSVNATLLHFGQSALPEKVVSAYIGDGAGTLVRRSLAHAHLVAAQTDPHDDAFVAEALAWFLDYYRVHKLDYTYVYPGVVESLTELREAYPQLPMAVLTNKPAGPSREICTHFGLDRFFFQNYGGDSFGAKKPDPEGLLALVEEASVLAGERVLASEAVMIGDSEVDVTTARNCRAMSIGCLYGFAPDRVGEADATVRSAWEWRSALRL